MKNFDDKHFSALKLQQNKHKQWLWTTQNHITLDIPKVQTNKV